MKRTLTVFATLLRTFAEEIEALAEESAANPAEVTVPPAKKPGRPKKETPAVTEPATAVASATQETTAAPVEQPTGKTVEELRAIIAPVVKGQAGPQVKEVMRKYGCESIVEISQKPEVHADFQKDIEAIVY